MKNKIPIRSLRHGDLSHRFHGIVNELSKLNKRLQRNSNLLKRQILTKDEIKKEFMEDIKTIIEKELEASKGFADIIKIISTLDQIYEKNKNCK